MRKLEIRDYLTGRLMRDIRHEEYIKEVMIKFYKLGYKDGKSSK